MVLEYITEKELETLTLEELEARVLVLKQKLRDQQKEFQDKKKHLLDEIQVPINWFLTRVSPSGRLKDAAEWVIPKTKAKTDIISFDATLTSCIEDIRQEEGPNFPPHLSLAVRLEKLHTKLCFSGHLPRQFNSKVRPIIQLEFTSMRRGFSSKANGVFTSHTSEQTRLLDNLERDLSNSITERDVESAINRIIGDVRELIFRRKSALSVGTYKFREGLGLETNELLLEKLLEFKKKLNDQGCLAEPSSFSSDVAGLQRVITNIERRIVSRREGFAERKSKFIKSHTVAFDSVKNFKLHLPPPIREFVTSQERLFVDIPTKIPDDENTTLPELRQNYSNFWFSLSNAVSKEVYDRKNAFRKEWVTFHDSILEARKQLQEQGNLTYAFAQDKRHEIIMQYDSDMHQSRKKNILRSGELRQRQLDDLRTTLCASSSPEQASTAIWSKIYTIEEDHAATSFFYNLAIYRKPSRAAASLRTFEENCRKHGLLPQAQEIPKTQLTTVIEQFRDAIDAYFDKDILFSNRTYRYHTKILMRRLRAVDEHLRRKEISFIAAQDMMSGYIEESIQDIMLAERPGVVSKFFSYMAGGSACTLTQSLLGTKTQLERSKTLLPSYHHVILPKIKSAFQSALTAYLSEGESIKKAAEQKRAESSAFGKVVEVVGDVLEAGANKLADAFGLESGLPEDREEGVKQGRELMLALFNDVCNGQHAAFILENGIKSLREAYPILAAKITDAMQGLKENGTLPTLTLEEFGSYLRDKVKKEAELVANMKAGIEKLERLERACNRSKGHSADDKPTEPFHKQAATVPK